MTVVAKTYLLAFWFATSIVTAGLKTYVVHLAGLVLSRTFICLVITIQVLKTPVK